MLEMVHTIDGATLNFDPYGSLGIGSKRVITIIFLFMVILESSFLYWQFGLILSRKSADDVSLVAFAILLATNVIWFLFAFLVVGSLPIAVSGALYVVGASLIIGAKLYYHRSGKKVEEDDGTKNGTKDEVVDYND